MLRTMTILVALTLAGTIAANGLNVTVHGEVYVSGRVILLRDITALSGDANLIATASQISCGRAPVDGSKSAVEVTREYILGRLMAAGVSELRVEMGGASRAAVYGAAAWGVQPGPKLEAPTSSPTAPAAQSAPISAATPAPAQPQAAGVAVANRQSLISVATDEIRHATADRLKATVEEIEVIESIPNPALLRLGAGRVQFLSVRNTGNRGGPLGKHTFEINATLDGELQTSLLLIVTLARLTDTVVANRPLVPGTFITDGDLRVERLPVTSLVVNTHATIAALVGMEVARATTIAEGTAIESIMVKPGTMIRRNETVTVTGKFGSTSIEFKATALSVGVRGGTVQVEWAFRGADGVRPEKKVIVARVTGVGTAELIE